MALKRQHESQSMFSMSSMTDVIFLLLIFFMVTSTFVFPTALEVNLPQSSQTTALKPTSHVYIDSLQQVYVTTNDSLKESEPRPLAMEQLPAFLADVKANNDPEHQFVALHANVNVPYGKIVEILDMGSRVGLKIVLATTPAASSYASTRENQSQNPSALIQGLPAPPPTTNHTQTTTN